MVPVCMDYCSITWDIANRYAYFSFVPYDDGSYAVPRVNARHGTSKATVWRTGA